MSKKNKTQALHLNIDEMGLMANLLYVSMQATGKPFKEQAPQVQALSSKIARAYQVLEKFGKPKETKVVDFGSFKMTTVTEAVKGVSNEHTCAKDDNGGDEGDITSGAEPAHLVAGPTDASSGGELLH